MDEEVKGWSRDPAQIKLEPRVHAGTKRGGCFLSPTHTTVDTGVFYTCIKKFKTNLKENKFGIKRIDPAAGRVERVGEKRSLFFVNISAVFRSPPPAP